MKKWISNCLLQARQYKYNKCYERKVCPYDTWIREKEKSLICADKEGNNRNLRVAWIPYEAGESYLQKFEKASPGDRIWKTEAQVSIFHSAEGRAAAFAEELIVSRFSESPELLMLYGDEDVISPEGIRYTPWLKPDWSPDTFLSFFYFGNIFAVRTKALEGFHWRKEEDDTDNLYRLCMKIARDAGGFNKRTGDIYPVAHVDEILFHTFCNTEMELRERAVREEPAARRKAISVIIPSKDQPETLRRCVLSFSEQLGDQDEIIVVDNGSRKENRETIGRFLREQDISYLYEPMEFNFSRMCNLGAENALGEILVFLNDDVEAPPGMSGWLKLLGDRAQRPYAGAVGVKLLYPASQRIQHAGIWNQKLGPVHKLQFKEDNISYYYGWNRRERNVIAVTGACLAVEKKKFKEAGGFPESLAVAFNDVALCFSLHGLGYYNGVSQDIILYHHESLSRGKDDEEEKLQRLLEEREVLYRMHRDMEDYDPYGHKYFANAILSTGFETGAEYDYSCRKMGRQSIELLSKLPEGIREDQCLMISLEFAGACARESEREQTYYLQGYAFVAGSDNARYEKSLILKDNENIYKIKAEGCLRREVEENLPDQSHVGLSGFVVLIAAGAMKPGSYLVGVLAEDTCTRGKLINWTGRRLKVGE